jgi:putative membrane protein
VNTGERGNGTTGERDVHPLFSRSPVPRSTFGAVLLATVLAVLTWSGIAPHDRFTWFLEVVPVLIGVPIVVATAKRFPLTPLAYALLAVHACILMVGGKYTYAEVPAGFWVQELMGWTRNNYDRLGHFAQGFVPAIIGREILLRTSPLKRGKWLAFLVFCICLAISASYELFEWATAVSTGTAADAFLGTQGDPWDTQSDMFLALVGAGVGLLALARVQDRQMGRLEAIAVRE